MRPPGHHAERSRALGFCFLNNAVIAARHWQKAHGRRRVLVFDFDAHHGNGIQHAFEADPDVLYVSLHEHPTFSFPGTGYAEETGTGPGEGATLNIPLLPGARDAAALEALEERVDPAVRAFRPEAIVVAAGFDGHLLDDMSGLGYSTDLFRRLGRAVSLWAADLAGGRALTLLEGGYHIGSLCDGVEQYLFGLLGARRRPQRRGATDMRDRHVHSRLDDHGPAVPPPGDVAAPGAGPDLREELPPLPGDRRRRPPRRHGQRPRPALRVPLDGPQPAVRQDQLERLGQVRVEPS